MFRRDFKFFNQDEFQNELTQVDWISLITTQNKSSDQHFQDFFKTLESLVNDHAPLKKLTKKQLTLKSKPWINQHIQRRMNYRDRIFKKYQSERNNVLKSSLWIQYKSERNLISHLLTKAKQNYFSNYFLENKSNITNIWQGIKSLINSKLNKQSKSFTLEHNNCIISNPLEISEIFNEYFVNVGPNLAKKIPKSLRKSYDYLKNVNINSIYLTPTTEDEIFKIISNLDSKKSTGPNSIPIAILNDNKNILSLPISLLVNQSFNEGIFPNLCKIAKVIPIHKKGHKTVSSNYQPISLLSIFSKIFEKCMYTRIYSFLEKYQIIYNRQFGFRSKHSTNHALCSLIETVKTFLDNGNFVCGIFIDLQKAFDTVDHEIMMHKTVALWYSWYYTYEWLKSFLVNRKQFVSINGYESDCKIIKCGVPQGSTLGPLLSFYFTSMI